MAFLRLCSPLSNGHCQASSALSTATHHWDQTVCVCHSEAVCSVPKAADFLPCSWTLPAAVCPGAHASSERECGGQLWEGRGRRTSVFSLCPNHQVPPQYVLITQAGMLGTTERAHQDLISLLSPSPVGSSRLYPWHLSLLFLSLSSFLACLICSPSDALMHRSLRRVCILG